MARVRTSGSLSRAGRPLLGDREACSSIHQLSTKTYNETKKESRSIAAPSFGESLVQHTIWALLRWIELHIRRLRCVCCAYVGWYLAFCVPSHQALSSADRYGHKALVSGPHVVTVHVGRTVDVAQVKGAFVGIEDERATVVGEKVPGLRVVVVEEHVFGVGELHRDGVEVGVVGLQVSGDEHEILLLTRAGVDEEPHRAGAIAPVGVLLENFVVGNMLWRLEVPDLCIPSIGSRPLCVFPFRPRGAYLLEGHGRRAHLRLLEGPYRLLCKPQREEDDGDEGQDQGRCTVQVRDSFGHSKSTTGSP